LNKQKALYIVIYRALILVGIAGVGMAGFEPAASTSQMWRDTGLRYIPIGIAKVGLKIAAANIF
jgi:hypothetical protein